MPKSYKQNSNSHSGNEWGDDRVLLNSDEEQGFNCLFTTLLIETYSPYIVAILKNCFIFMPVNLRKGSTCYINFNIYKHTLLMCMFL